MTLAQIRTLLRRRLEETTSDQWDDGDLDSLINVALGRMETLILRIDPDAFVSLYTKDLTANQPYYEAPAGQITLLMLEQKDSSGAYTKIGKRKRVDLLSRTSGETELLYARLGRKNIMLSPTPSASVADGLRWTFVNTLTVADDDDVPDIPIPLHIGIVYWAEVMAIGEGRQSAKDTASELSTLLQDLPFWYMTHGDEPDTLDIDLSKNMLE